MAQKQPLYRVRERDVVLGLMTFGKSISDKLKEGLQRPECENCGDNRHRAGSDYCRARMVSCNPCRQGGHYSRCGPEHKKRWCYGCASQGCMQRDCRSTVIQKEGTEVW